MIPAREGPAKRYLPFCKAAVRRHGSFQTNSIAAIAYGRAWGTPS
jgi:hypothetical protein